MVAVQRDALLPRHEREAFAQLQQEGLKVGDEGGFEFRLNEPGGFGQAEEFDDDGVFEQVGGFGDFLAFAGEAEETLFVLAGGEAFVEEAVDLAFEFAGGPVVLDGFDFLEGAGFGFVHAKERTVVRP
jgi:hypothetical protein